jgi:hypothetical protein
VVAAVFPDPAPGSSNEIIGVAVIGFQMLEIVVVTTKVEVNCCFIKYRFEPGNQLIGIACMGLAE